MVNSQNVTFKFVIIARNLITVIWIKK